MLDPDEPNQQTQETTQEVTVQAPQRRRRAASRPAGPPSSAPDAPQIERLAQSSGEANDDGLAYERTRSDMSSSADRPGRVHGRVGEACPVCGDTIRSVKYSGYTVAYCPTCQTDGKVLADNTTSRFLK